MSDKEPENGWSKTKRWIAGLTGLLVIVPSLINSAKNVYDEVNKIPRTDVERTNVEFFKKYWGKKPVSEIPLLIKRGVASYEVNFYVYEEGDVFVQYGNMTQWFAFPSQTVSLGSTYSLMSSAYAADPSYYQIEGGYKQIDSFQGGDAIRERSYFNGIKERQVIDMRTGTIIKQNISHDNPVPTADVPKSSRSIRIDLDSPSPTFNFTQ